MSMQQPTIIQDHFRKKEIYNLIKLKEAAAEEYGYRGSSCSRITGETLGSREYKTDEWLWPCDFAKHYVLDHKVRPTDEFLDYIEDTAYYGYLEKNDVFNVKFVFVWAISADFV